MTVSPPLLETVDVPQSVAIRAAESVAPSQSARGLAVPIWAALTLPPVALALLVSNWATWVVAPAFALVVALRLAALFNLALPRPAHAPPLDGAELPSVTILLPLYKEAKVVPDLVQAIERIDYPRASLEVLVLLEADDAGTLATARRHVPAGANWRILILPPGSPRTKPRALNVGLSLARGELVVVFDGEDRPEPGQARKAAAALAADPRLAVAQARLGCDHAGPRAPLVARLWTLEYAGLFGALLPLLSRFGLPFPLGGTSNWFRASALRQAGGWDAHNVTEDADLGVRLARLGWRSTTLASTTWEEAPVTPAAWLHQRARWLKGFAVTSIVHGRQPLRAARELGPAGALVLLAQVPLTLLCAAAHPVGLTLILLGDMPGPLGPLLLTGYGVVVVLHVAAAVRTGLSPWLALLLPVYWLGHTCALGLALVDLVRDPAHWRKTTHAVARRPHMERAMPEVAAGRSELPAPGPRPVTRRLIRSRSDRPTFAPTGNVVGRAAPEESKLRSAAGTSSGPKDVDRAV